MLSADVECVFVRFVGVAEDNVSLQLAALAQQVADEVKLLVSTLSVIFHHFTSHDRQPSTVH